MVIAQICIWIYHLGFWLLIIGLLLFSCLLLSHLVRCKCLKWPGYILHFFKYVGLRVREMTLNDKCFIRQTTSIASLKSSDDEMEYRRIINVASI